MGKHENPRAVVVSLPTGYTVGWKHGRTAFHREEPIDCIMLRRGARRMARGTLSRDERAYFLGFARAVTARVESTRFS